MKKYINSICMCISVILYFFYNMMDNTVLFIGGTVFAIPGIRGILYSSKLPLKTFTVVAFIGSVLDIFFTSYGIGGSIVFLVCCGITFLCLNNLKCFFTISLLLCVGLLLFLYYQLFIIGTINGDIFLQYGLSKNYPGSLLVIFNCMWAIWKHLHYKTMPFLLPILSTVMCFFLDGRSSLVCMVFITLTCFILRGGLKVTLIMTIICSVLLIQYWDYLYGYYEMTSLAEKGTESVRSLLWSTYLSHLDLSSFLFGLDTQNLPELRMYGGNPHNSFLSFHRRLGLLGFVSLLYYLISSYKEQIRRKEYVTIVIVTILMIRLFFDGMLVTAEDFFIFTIIFLPLCFNDNKFQISEQINSYNETWCGRLWRKLIFIV